MPCATESAVYCSCVYLLLSGWQTSQLSCTWLVEYRASEKLASENNRHLATLPLVFPPNNIRNERRNSILMTRDYPDLGNASDWSCRVGNFIQPIRSTTQIWVVTRHQYFCACFSDVILAGKPVVTSPKQRRFLF